jgi:hypothetical protein
MLKNNRRLIGLYKAITVLIALMAISFAAKLFLARKFIIIGIFLLWLAFLGINYIWSNVSHDLKEEQEPDSGGVKTRDRPILHPATTAFLMRFRIIVVIVVSLLILLSLKYTFIDDKVFDGIVAFSVALSFIFSLLDGYMHRKDSGSGKG